MSDEADGLQRWFRVRYGADTEILNCETNSAGFSNETWSVTVQSDDEIDELILRKPRTEIKFFPEYDLDFQYDILRNLRDTEVPAPAPLEIEHDPSYLGTPFYLMRRIAPDTGTVPGRRPAERHPRHGVVLRGHPG